MVLKIFVMVFMVLVLVFLSFYLYCFYRLLDALKRISLRLGDLRLLLRSCLCYSGRMVRDLKLISDTFRIQ